jgi:hypothetical protein
VKSYRILATLTTGGEVVVAEINDNHQRNRSHLTDLTKVTSIRVECIATNGLDRVQIYAIRVFGKAGNVTLQSE